ncbi:FG-GAP-like repeat-containing protein, partial [Microcoleus sp. Pol7_B1]|uniref:FG-GAP-like repeat-containing protein n=1 Tax=Microcoleus sp. Pol7_B1 TaxID=2818894 RepID=UPI002FD0D9AF
MNLSTPNKQIIFVDPSVQNYQNLIEGADANAKIVILDDKRSGLEQITKALASESGIEAVHVVSHGNQGSLKLGAEVLNEKDLGNFSQKLKQWGQALTQNADILLYGCSIAKGEAGLKFVKHFSELTGANIAASAHPTGSAQLGGDWNLEVQIGDISTPIAFNANTLKTYSGVLGFATKVDFTTGSNPKSVSIGDFNGDGKPDLAVANYVNNTTSILLNTTTTGATTPTFATKVDFTTGSSPKSVSIGDINGDGKPDLAVANSGGTSILLNTTATGATTPTFATKVDFTTGGSPYSVSIGDFNGDGKPDLAVASSNSYTTAILLNTTPTGATTPTFATRVDFTTGSGSRSVSIGDFNGDGKPDLAVANYFSNTTSILLNTTTTGATTPTFATKVDFTTGNAPNSVSIGDFNGDGKPDLAVANSYSTSILLNTTPTGATTPTFATKVDFTTGGGPNSVSIGDFNGDGKPDLAVAVVFSKTTSILLNTTATGATTPTFATNVDFTTGTYPRSVSIGDINGDGKPDLAVANSGSNTTSILLSTTPKVTAVTATTPDGSYGVGSTIAITVTFDAAVNVTGTPQLQLETGTTDQFANYVSGSGGTVLTFNYVVQAGDTSLDLEYATTALTLNGGTIQDSLTANADLTLPALATANSLGGSKAIVIDALNDQPGFTATSPAAVNEDAGEQTLTSWATFNPGPADEAAQTATYTVSNIGNGALFSGAPTINNANGNLTYTPAPKAFGTSTFDVRVQDNGGIVNGGVDTSTTQTFTITVNGINDQPSFSNSGNQTLATSTNTLQTVPSWASAFNFGPNEAGQAVNDFLVNITNGNSLFTALPDVANDGTLTYTPNGNPGTATIQVQLQDNGGTANGGVDTSTASSFTITIPPPVVNLSVTPTTGTEAGTTSITVTATAAAPVAGNQTVDLALTGVATAADFTGTIPTQITIADGASSGQVTFTITDDQITEIDETANLTISNPSAGIQLGTTTTGSFTITDNDTAGFDLLPISGNTSEFGGIATFDIRLKSQPTADVILGLTSNNTAEGTVLPANLTFNSTNWNAYQTATITGVDDAVADGDIAYQIITAPDTTTADTNYNNLNPADVTVTNTDNDIPGVTLTQSAGSTEVTEGGITDTYTLQLNTLPTSNVNVTVTADTQAQVSLDGTNFAAAQTLTFTNVNGQTPQTVTVRAVDDTLPENNHTGALTHAITNSTDPNYPTTLAIGPVNPQITDNDITYSIVGSTATVTEGDSGTQVVSFTITRTGETNQSSSIDFSFGGTATNAVDYNNANVTGTGVTATGSTVTFAANATIATIAVAVAGDRITEPNETLALTLSNATAPGTANIIGSPVTTTIQDDDTAGISITPTSGLTTTEAGGTATFTVVLDSQPTADVTIGMTSDKTAEGTVDKPSLTFTSANWNTPQTVTVTGVDDFVVDGNAAYNIITAAATSTDTNYSGVNASDVAVTNTDNDTKGITITPITGLTTTEAGSTATFTVVLNSQPTADVTIGTTSDKTAEGTVDKPSVTFTPANWNTPQTVTVTGVDDSVVDGNAAYNIVTAPATSTDTNYSGVNANDVAVTNTDDNDTKGIIVTPTSGLTTTEAWKTATFTVVLNSQPTADVLIGTTSDNTAEGTVNKPSLTFTPANWNTPQTVTITGRNDFVVDGNVAYNIVTAPATSTDTIYSGVNANDVAVTNTDDNDTKGIIVT